jgi:protein-S-isoprenylcysteine O-methyltransferase Ste14
MTAQASINVLWLAWYVTWIGAVIWSGKTRTQLKTDMVGPHRLFSGLGGMMVFLPSHGLQDTHSLWTVLRSRLWEANPGLDWTLLALAVGAFAFCWWARAHLGRLWSGFVTLKEDHHIVDTGPYGLVRHPIYTGVIAAMRATAFIRATPAALVGTVLFAVGFSMTARIEERFLRSQLGADAYDSYSRRVGMLVPRFG